VLERPQCCYMLVICVICLATRMLRLMSMSINQYVIAEASSALNRPTLVSGKEETLQSWFKPITRVSSQSASLCFNEILYSEFCVRRRSNTITNGADP